MPDFPGVVEEPPEEPENDDDGAADDSEADPAAGEEVEERGDKILRPVVMTYAGEQDEAGHAEAEPGCDGRSEPERSSQILRPAATKELSQQSVDDEEPRGNLARDNWRKHLRIDVGDGCGNDTERRLKSRPEDGEKRGPEQIALRVLGRHRSHEAVLAADGRTGLAGAGGAATP